MVARSSREQPVVSAVCARSRAKVTAMASVVAVKAAAVEVEPYNAVVKRPRTARTSASSMPVLAAAGEARRGAIGWMAERRRSRGEQIHTCREVEMRGEGDEADGHSEWAGQRHVLRGGSRVQAVTCQARQ